MTRNQKCDTVRACVRVHVHVIALVIDAVCLMLVLSARVVVHAVVLAFP